VRTAAQPGSRPPADLREQIIAFVRSLRKPVLEPGLAGENEPFPLAVVAEPEPNRKSQPPEAFQGQGWRLEVEFGKLLLEVWGEGGSVVRRIEGVERHASRLRLWAARPGWSDERVALEIREADDIVSGAGAEPRDSGLDSREGSGEEPAARRARDREGFESDLVAMLVREFPGWSLERVSHRPDRERCFSGCYTRGWARRGREAWAFLGLSAQEGPSAAENALAYGLIWLDWLRRRSAEVRRERAPENQARAGYFPEVTGLKLLLPPEAVAVAAHRAAYLDQSGARIEILDWTPPQDQPRPVDLRDYGNVETRLTPRWRGARLAEELRSVVENLLRGLPEELIGSVKAVADPAGEALSLRVRGLEVARIEPGSIPKIYFGLEGARTLLDESRRAEFQEFLGSAVRWRRARSADRAHLFYRLQAERWLESLLVEDLGRVDPAFVPEHVYPQVPAFSGPATRGLSRGVIDILGVTRDRESASHRLAVVELKLDEDPNLPLQGLDYWLRVKWLEDRGQFREAGYFPGLTPSPAPPVLYLVSPAFRYHSTTEHVLGYFDPSIRVVKVGVNQLWREGVKILFRKTLKQGRALEEREPGNPCDDGRSV